MTDEVLANAPEARTETGEIKDVSTTQTETKPELQTTEPKAPEQTSTPPKEGETLLTAGEKKEEPKAAPDKYEDFKLPDGVELKGPQLEEAQKIFKEMNLPQAEAQKLVDFHTAQLKAISDAGASAVSEMRADWQSKTKAQYNETQLAEVKTNVAKLYSAVGDTKLVEDFKGIMNLTGVGDHPAFISVLNKLASFVMEGKHVAGGQPSAHGQNPGGAAEKPSAAHALYPNLP